MSLLKIGAAQIAEKFMDKEGTVQKDIDYIEQAGDIGLDLMVFPEFHIPASPHWYRFVDDLNRTEYYLKLFENAVEIPGETTEKLCDASKRAGTAVVIGVNEKEPGTAGTMY